MLKRKAQPAGGNGRQRIDKTISPKKTNEKTVPPKETNDGKKSKK